MLVLSLALGMASVAQAKTATRITMSRRTMTMDWGTRFTLAVTVTPSGASDKNSILWTSSNESLIKVQADASTRKALVTVRPLIAGESYPLDPVVITATTSQGRTATCTIRIAQVNVKSISVSPATKTVYLTKSQPTYQMSAPTFNPSVAGDQLSYTWSSSDASVATVDSAGLVTFNTEGTVRIIATYAAGTVNASDSCTFTIKPVRVKSIALRYQGSPISSRYLGQGESIDLTTVVTSAISGKLPSYETVKWSSADSSIAKVESDGKVTAQSKSGIVKITASVDTGKYAKTASCQIYVREASPARITITAGGDCVLGGDPRKGNGVITARSTQDRYQSLIKSNGALYPFAKVANLFANGTDGRTNLSIVNLEVCLTTKGGSGTTTDRKFLFRGSPSNAQALGEAGIDIANIANNHTADFGMSSFTNTATNVKKYSSAEPVGYNRYNGANYVPVKTVGDKKIGFYSFQAGQMPLSMVESRVRKVKSDNKLDMLVLTIHWTGQNEYVRPVSATMKNYARKAIDAGADLVIGHHRHEVSGIEFYKGKYILYDLGNFVTGGASTPYSYAVQIDFDVSGGFAETTSNGSQIRIYPLYTTSQACYVWNKKSGKYERQSNNWQPVPAEAAIHHMEGDTEVRDEGVADSVTSIITRYSPNGPDGKFNPAPYIHKYSELIG